MRPFLLLILVLCSSAVAQTEFRINDASRFVDVAVDVGECGRDEHSVDCGPLRVSFFRKTKPAAFQIIILPRTNMWDDVPKANVTRRYDDQSIINFGDFNFDGIDDVAICDGRSGGYGMPSYRVYLYSPAHKRFRYSRSFTRMNYGGLGMFETDRRKRLHYVFTKSGCCHHETDGFDVYRGRPRKVYKLIETSAYGDGTEVEISTSKLIRERWRTWIKRVKSSEYYAQ